jgi:hypothetical protein
MRKNFRGKRHKGTEAHREGAKLIAEFRLGNAEYFITY